MAEVAATIASPISRVRGWVGGLLGRSLDRVKEVRISELAVQLRERLAGADEASWRQSASALFAAIPSDHVLIFDEFPGSPRPVPQMGTPHIGASA